MLIPLRDLNPRTRFPAVTLAVLLVNVAVFVVQVTLDPAGQHRLVLAAGAIPFEVTRLVDLSPPNLWPPPLGIVTSMFLHGGLLHLAGNMWFLWLFGDNVEEALGRPRYVAFYLGTGVAGALAQCFAMPESKIPMIGASGAVAGVLGAYFMLYPRARVVTLVFLVVFLDRVALPAWFFLGVWFVGQFFIGEGSGVAWIAHAGGFLAGAGAARLAARPRSGAAVRSS